MNRRDVLEVLAAAGLAGSLTARAADPPMGAPAHHDHAAMTSPHADLVTTTSRCVRTGDACIAHCLGLLSEGDKEMAACARTVEDVVAACTALERLAAADSPHVAKLAAAVADICTDCETECRKHEKQHSVCRDCAEACVQCTQECRKAAAV